MNAPGQHEFKPDWTVAPAAILREWIKVNGVSPRLLAVAAVGKDRRDKAIALIEGVLDRQPLTEECAQILAVGTQVPARFWLALETNYRNGLAAGLKDVTAE